METSAYNAVISADRRGNKNLPDNKFGNVHSRNNAVPEKTCPICLQKLGNLFVDSARKAYTKVETGSPEILLHGRSTGQKDERGRGGTLAAEQSSRIGFFE